MVSCSHVEFYPLDAGNERKFPASHECNGCYRRARSICGLMGLCPIPTGRVVSPHLPLSFQGMKNNEEDIMDAPEGMARWSQRAELYSGSNTADLLITNIKLTFLGSF